jgi:hypothetical protein
MTVNHPPLAVVAAEPASVPVEIRAPVDAREAPLAYVESDGVLVVEVAGAGHFTTLVLPVEEARAWAGELFSAVAVAYREATGDPHALTDFELASLPPAVGYRPGRGLIVHGDETSPARARFHVEVEITAEFLSTAGLRAALVEAITGQFNVSRIAVSAGEATSGTVLNTDP